MNMRSGQNLYEWATSGFANSSIIPRCLVPFTDRGYLAVGKPQARGLSPPHPSPAPQSHQRRLVVE